MSDFSYIVRAPYSIYISLSNLLIYKLLTIIHNIVNYLIILNKNCLFPINIHE